MANLSDLIPLVRERVHNCPDPVILDALRWAARDFCQKTHVWTYNGTVNLVGGQSAFTFIPTAGTNVVAWRYLAIDENAQQLTVLDRPEWREVRSDSLPRFVYFENILRPSFDAMPEANLAIRYEIAVMPDNSTDVVDDQMVNTWGDFISAGARYRLMTQPDRFWADGNGAQIELMEYREGMMHAKQHIHKGMGTTPKRVLQNRFI